MENGAMAAIRAGSKPKLQFLVSPSCLSPNPLGDEAASAAPVPMSQRFLSLREDDASIGLNTIGNIIYYAEEFLLLESLPFIRKFSAKEIRRATDEFSMILGSGSHGTIYRARLPNGQVAAVRRPGPLLQEGKKDSFRKEVQLLGCLHHRHLVRLLGFSEGDNRFLVFDHMENGSLKEYLHDPLRTPLNWRTRLQIAIDVASALEYLYYFCDPPVYEVSLNSNTVLLDENFVAKLSDVGFLKCDCNQLSESESSCSRDHIDERSKNLIFQFGLLVLELVTGQSLGGEDAEVVQWVQDSRFTYSMHKMVDMDLGGDYNSDELKSLLIVARLCTRNGDKPIVTISQIHRYLIGKAEHSARF